MTRRLIRRVLMAATGAVLVAAGLLAAPGTGGAIDNPTVETTVPSLPETTLAVPGEADPLVKQVEGLTSSTITSTTTTTTVPPTTTTTVATGASTTTTTTTTTVPKDKAHDDEGPAEVLGLDALLAQIEVPVIDVPAIVADYHRTEFPAYTPRFGKRSTLELMNLLESLNAPFEVQTQVIAPFPVAGPASFTDDWGAARYNPTFHLHEGTDIFAEGGTPVIATMSGKVSRIGRGTAVGGNSVYVQLPDGTYFYYAHLDQISDVIYEGMPVEAGQVLGTVGNSGNAEGGAPHLHFEIHPGGGDPVPPAPYLDAWLASAMEEAKQLSGLPAGDPPPFPTPFVNASGQAGVLPAEPASFGRESTESLLFVVPGAAILWWRRRRAAAVLVSKGILKGD